MRSIRVNVLQDPNLEFKLTFAKRSPGLPDWWIPGIHDRAFLEGVSKHGMTPLRQNRIMFDADLPFRPIVEEKLSLAGYGDKLESLIQQSTLTKMELKEIKKGENTGDDGNDDEGAAVIGGVNLEEVVGWPRDLIRSRRVEILMDLVMNPSHKALSMLQYFGKESQTRKTDGLDAVSETGSVPIDTGVLHMSRRVQRLKKEQPSMKIKLDLNNVPLNDEEEEIVNGALKQLKKTMKYIKKNRTSRELIHVLREFYEESDGKNGKLDGDHTEAMDVDSAQEEGHNASEGESELSDNE